jgi:hypothetical protein
MVEEKYHNHLLIHADPGARSGFVASWLTDKLSRVSFDSGAEFKPQFTKIHRLQDASRLKNFNGVKIRIKPTLSMIDQHALLFLRKNVYTNDTNKFTFDEFSFETLSKLDCFVDDILCWDSKLDYKLYDHVILFSDTYSTQSMIDLYQLINHQMPDDTQIKILELTNQNNCFTLDKNHACAILKLILTKEHILNLNKKQRFWSIVDVYQNTKKEKLYNTIDSLICDNNYGILS